MQAIDNYGGRDFWFIARFIAKKVLHVSILASAYIGIFQTNFYINIFNDYEFGWRGYSVEEGSGGQWHLTLVTGDTSTAAILVSYASQE